MTFSRPFGDLVLRFFPGYNSYNDFYDKNKSLSVGKNGRALYFCTKKEGGCETLGRAVLQQQELGGL